MNKTINRNAQRVELLMDRRRIITGSIRRLFSELDCITNELAMANRKLRKSHNQ